ILGILAAIVVPQFSQASSDAQLNSLMSNLQVMRGQLELYKIQHNSTYPTLANFTAEMTTKTNVDGSTTGSPSLGPYIQKVPNNPFTNTNTVTKGALGTSAWYYDDTNGQFTANDAGHQSL